VRWPTFGTPVAITDAAAVVKDVESPLVIDSTGKSGSLK
jgi:hypothetical protein